MSQRLLAAALLALVALSAIAQERPAASPKRGAYVVKFASAKDIAGILAKHFKGDAEIQAGPEGTSNCLLVSAAPAVFDEVLKTIEKLDRRPHSVAVDLFLVELPAKKDDDKRLDEKALAGPIDDVVKHLGAMQKKGLVAGVKRIQLRTLEGQLASLVVGETRPFAMGGGRFTTYRDLGTQVRVTPQVTGDNSVTLDLTVQDSRARDSAVAGTPEFTMTSLRGKISVASGKAAPAKDVKGSSKDGKGDTLIVVGARVVDVEGK